MGADAGEQEEVGPSPERRITTETQRHRGMKVNFSKLASILKFTLNCTDADLRRSLVALITLIYFLPSALLQGILFYKYLNNTIVAIINVAVILVICVFLATATVNR